MKNKKIYCYKCDKNVDYNVKERKDCVEFRNEKVEYFEKYAVCNKCGHEVFVQNIWDSNLNTIRSIYAKRHDVITVNEIDKITDKYAISLTALSSLIGCGIATMKRYHLGKVPSLMYSDIMKNILNNPIYYRDLLIKNNEIKNSTKKKSLNIVNNIIEEGYLFEYNKSNILKSFEIEEKYLDNINNEEKQTKCKLRNLKTYAMAV